MGAPRNKPWLAVLVAVALLVPLAREIVSPSPVLASPPGQLPPLPSPTPIPTPPPLPPLPPVPVPTPSPSPSPSPSPTPSPSPMPPEPPSVPDGGTR